MNLRECYDGGMHFGAGFFMKTDTFILCTLLSMLTTVILYAGDQCPMLTGKVVRPGDSEYDHARLVSNYYASKNKYPVAIVYCGSAKDVQNAVLWAKCQKLPVRVRSGGHNHEGFSTGNGALVIDVSKMKGVTIDKDRMQAQIEPGITGGELYTLLAKKGFTQSGGTCADVGLSGLVLTGGMGPLSRINGLTCDSLISFDMVGAEGNIIHVTKDNEHKDLFWAACGGGGGNFGIVISMTLHIFPSNEVTWFNIGWDWSQPVNEIIKGWQTFFMTDDKRWFSHLDVWAKPFPTVKLKKLPIKVIGIFYGKPEMAEALLEPLLTIGKPSSKIIKTVAWRKAIEEFEDSTTVFLTDKPEYKSTGAFAMKPLPDKAINIIVDTLRDSQSPLLNFLMFSLGGAIKEKTPNETAYFHRNAMYFLCYSSQWLNEKDATKNTNELYTLRQRLLPYTEGNYIGNPDRSHVDHLSTYFGSNAKRLRHIKEKYDRHNVFKFEQGISSLVKPST